MIVIIDHFDSFVFNLAHYFMALGQEVVVWRQNQVTLDALKASQMTHLVLSPGPCGPTEAEISIEAVKTFVGHVHILGVCLGHQILGHVFGGLIQKALRPMHGQASLLTHTGKGLFHAMPHPCRVGRYHSLVVTETGLDPMISIVARSEEHEIMAMVSGPLRVAGVQFHPESVLTDQGHQLLKNFLTGAFVEL